MTDPSASSMPLMTVLTGPFDPATRPAACPRRCDGDALARDGVRTLADGAKVE